ncbi:carbohydrate ABC transporter permease, partial [Streptomyces brasiliscabiei]
AYGAFLYAFLVAQDRRVWTLMVWIYQLQGTAPKAVMMAALTLAALPTLIVFLLAQKVILKGIVLPGER